jgi:hypothetical protein
MNLNRKILLESNIPMIITERALKIIKSHKLGICTNIVIALGLIGLARKSFLFKKEYKQLRNHFFLKMNTSNYYTRWK